MVPSPYSRARRQTCVPPRQGGRPGRSPDASFAPASEACFLRHLQDTDWAPRMLCHNDGAVLMSAVGKTLNPHNIPPDWQLVPWAEVGSPSARRSLSRRIPRLEAQYATYRRL